MKGRGLFWMAFVIAIVALTWRDIHDCHDLPWPPRYIGAGITFGMLDILAQFQEELAGVVAVGIVLAILINKGFKSECNHSEGTVQPVSYQSLIPPPTETL